IKAIADRIAQAMLHRKLLDRQPIGDTREWSVIVGLLRRTDPALFLHVTRKLIYHLFRINVGEAAEIMQEFGAGPLVAGEEAEEESNRPLTRQPIDRLPHLADRTFELAARHLESGELFALIQKWIREDRASFLVKVAGNGNATLSQIVDALARFRQLGDEARELSPSAEKGLRVALIRRFFSEQLDFINIAKHHIGVDHFYDLVTHVIAPEGSHGQLGGKSAGLFLAKRVLLSEAENVPELQDIRTPRTWYVSADTVSVLLHYNNLEEVTEQKYKEIDQVRLEYPNIVQLLKNSHFPPQIVKGLSAALDSFGDRPLIVRSSSLLEDRLGTAFSGKYKSLFLANQGSKESRLSALLDAIAEVYASVFGPDPIGYRVERGLLDFNEEMGIMIQEVVGRKVGHYFFPLYAGVAFSRNEFRWSPRIRREDGLVRLVPGLGTRAVDRVSDDYPVLIAPRQPKLRVNVSDEEILHYSPRRMDVIDLEEGKGFTTISIPDLLAEVGDVFPELPLLFSHFEETYIRPLTGLEQHVGTLPLVATFNGLIQNTDFVTKIATMLRLLERE
ncbi:MAG TPA: PEP/pyruvate-binding domain-containing protein, partial [Candidatus Aminicenantes bacterium]|nr:PEP/pyruvate-binding domain-containing protein [Candidatus Aminicenantes bacterium]